MDNETIFLLGLGGLAAFAILKKLTAGDSNPERVSFIAALAAFEGGQKLDEKTFHRKLRAHLSDKMRLQPPDKIITEAAVQGSTVRLDLHAIQGDTDYLVTVKRGLSSQKVMTLVGEVTSVLHHWRVVPGRKTVLVVLVYDYNNDGGDDHLANLKALVRKVASQRPEVELHFALE